MLNAMTVEQYQLLMRWIHVPMWVLTLSLRRFRATLSTRRTIVAGVEHLRPADSGADSQFHFSGEYQLQQDHRHPPLFVGR